ncbi:SusD/RagB family nutrient-binding outer membrane lipoprotein [Fulvivirga lutea]|uniref:SusD/RagB family nutrient-binding outer membrane lipoprotein n=1 Tax=Fulvivirga lutea TaxID=2810512 RepID=A0A974WK28_9BACT|nr:SusD/RagB family nutrient-binding outer membrane lipoprotein [Fulvivirga lutea]QSE97292.1 SusD/RagB family nutrient-binding outer membrane lipoprotein [Fulvivirga lutea]QSE97595.1 SusD/RagB family nutrient-binding outer membrane lipoprotein [Fulvivirga lutea]
MRNLFKLKIYTLALSVMVLAGCEENFLDINDDPNNPLSVPTGQLMTAAQTNMSYTFANGSGGLGLYTGTIVKHWVQRGTLNDYSLQGTDFAVTTGWQSIYAGAMTDLQVAIEQATEEEDFATLGAAQLMRVYIMSHVVDLWGDVPYFEIGQGAGNESPTFDDGLAVYNDLFTLLETGLSNLEAGVDGSVKGDLIYSGSADSWITFGNSLKLRMLNNVRLQRDVTADAQAAITDGVIEAIADDFELDYGTSFNPENRNPGFSFEWTAGNGNYIDPFFFETLRGQDTFAHGGLLPAGAGVRDPRIPYYIFNQLPAGSGDADAENPCAYCPSRSGSAFLSIFSHSFNIDPNEGFDQSNSQSLAGLYPLGGRYDDGDGGTASNAATLNAGQVTGPGNTPQRLLDASEVYFIRAELAQVGVTNETARDLFLSALNTSFAKVNAVANSAGAPTMSATAISTYVNAVMANYDAASPAGQLELIMVSKWLAQFGNSTISYNDIRRTGFPRLHDGNTDNLNVTVQTRQFPVSLPYDINNLQLNAAAPSQRVIATDRVFWDVN